MIARAEAEKLAASVHALRRDWPLAQLVTLVAELQDWPLRDLGVALAYVALDQRADGSWLSKTPYRVKEQGPWRTIGVADADLAAARARAARELEQRRDDHRIRLAAIDGCQLCDTQGYLRTGRVCLHDPTAEVRAERGRQLVEAARQAVAASKRDTPDMATTLEGARP